MEKFNNNNVLKTIFIVFLSLLALFLVFAIFITIDKYNKKSYKLDVKFKNNSVVELTNKLPMADAIGKNYKGNGVEKGIVEYKEFTISNKNARKVKYEIFLTKIHRKNKDIRSNYIKLYLTDEYNKPVKGFTTNQVKSYYDLFALNDKPGSKLMYNGTLVSGESKKFVLRSWVADTYVLSNGEEEFNYEIEVRLK